jgi:hypothetical protein
VAETRIPDAHLQLVHEWFVKRIGRMSIKKSNLHGPHDAAKQAIPLQIRGMPVDLAVSAAVPKVGITKP